MEEGEGMIQLKTIAFMVFSFSSIHLFAEEQKQQKVNHSAIPPVISPDDPDMQKTTQDHIRILNAKKADHVTKGVRFGGKQVPRQEQKTRERIYQEKFDKNPRQTIPLKECIKPNGVIDNEVNECMNGRIKKTW